MQQKTKLATTPKTVVQVNVKSSRAPRQARREASHTKESRDPNAPTFVPCSLRGPDGQSRPGWELWVGDIVFGRADTKESLLAYYTRIHEPMPSGHWRERSWNSSPKVARRQRNEHYEEDYEEELALENDMVGVWD
jgi:hypothetical protein